MSISNESFLVQIGETSDGKIVKCDFSSVNNMLVSGTTGSGKTNFIYSLLYSLMKQNDPSEVRFMIFSSNVSDYSFINGSSYMLCPLLSDPRRVERMIAVATEEAAKRMENREKMYYEESKKSPHIFLILDDFARAIESGMKSEALRQLLVLSRLVNMHCVLVTSIPTSSVVASDIKALLPYRISFTTTSPQISRMVIGKAGAESLRYPGEMIYKCGNQTLTLNAAYSEDITDQIYKMDKQYRDEAQYDDELKRAIENLMAFKYTPDPHDELLDDAINYIFKSGQASVSMLQRRFRIGYSRASLIIDEIEDMGIIGPQDGARPRQLLISEDLYYGGIAGLGAQEQTEGDDSIVFSIEIEDEKNAADDWLGKNIFETLSPEQQAKIIDADYEDDY